jgi:two-component sensor histidine kinase
LLLEQAVLVPDVSSPRRARSFVRRVLRDHELVADSAVLMVSELATNAVLHARTDFAVRVLLTRSDGESIVRVEVEDANERPPMIGPTPTEATSGRGLQLVQRMATAWGVEPSHQGKVLWFEVPAEATARANAVVG